MRQMDFLNGQVTIPNLEEDRVRILRRDLKGLAELEIRHLLDNARLREPYLDKSILETIESPRKWDDLSQQLWKKVDPRFKTNDEIKHERNEKRRKETAGKKLGLDG